jgi:hypothetical protein
MNANGIEGTGTGAGIAIHFPQRKHAYLQVRQRFAYDIASLLTEVQKPDGSAWACICTGIAVFKTIFFLKINHRREQAGYAGLARVVVDDFRRANPHAIAATNTKSGKVRFNCRPWRAQWRAFTPCSATPFAEQSYGCAADHKKE